MRIAIATALALLAAVGGCRSAPISFYTLIPEAERTAPDSVLPSAAVDVGPVTVPPAIDRRELVIRVGTDRVSILDDQQWVAPLRDEVARALAASISARAGNARGGVRYRVRVDVLRLDAGPSNYVFLAAAWRVSKSDSTGVAGPSCTSRIHLPAGTTYAELVRGQREALMVLADQIATFIVRDGDGALMACPVPL